MTVDKVRGEGVVSRSIREPENLPFVAFEGAFSQEVRRASARIVQPGLAAWTPPRKGP